MKIFYVVQSGIPCKHPAKVSPSPNLLLIFLK